MAKSRENISSFQPQKHEPISPIETVQGAQIVNISGRPTSEIYNWFPRELLASKIVALPDIAPGKSPLPTGSCVEIDTKVHPDWRKYAISDVGCGMQVLQSELHWSDFDAYRALWDQLGITLKRNSGKLGDLGSGNHFIDAAVDENYQVFFVIHTGSRNESNKTNTLVDQPDKFDTAYQQVSNWAKSNREAIANMLRNVYGPIEQLLDTTHNFYRQENTTVRIYKGAVELFPGQLHVIPSSLNDRMAIITATRSATDLMNALSHGTGRSQSRAETKRLAEDYNFEYLREQVYIPDYISDASLRAELPIGYRELDVTLKLLQPYIEVQKYLTPIAYLGQL